MTNLPTSNPQLNIYQNFRFQFQSYYQYNNQFSPSSYLPSLASQLRLPLPQLPQTVSPPPPDLPSVTPQVASQIIQRLIAATLKNSGYDAAQPAAMQRLEVEVTACEDI